MANYVFCPVVSDSTAENIVNNGLLALNRGNYGKLYLGVTSGVVKVNYYYSNYPILVIGSLTSSQIVYYVEYLTPTQSSTGNFTTNEYTYGSVHYRHGFANSDNVPGFSIDTIYYDRQTAAAAMSDGNWDGPVINYPITYRLTNCTAPTAPTEAAVGDTVTVSLTFPEGYGVVNPASDAYVSCNGVLVSSTYSNGQLVFTMPDPS